MMGHPWQVQYIAELNQFVSFFLIPKEVSSSFLCISSLGNLFFQENGSKKNQGIAIKESRMGFCPAFLVQRIKLSQIVSSKLLKISQLTVSQSSLLTQNIRVKIRSAQQMPSKKSHFDTHKNELHCRRDWLTRDTRLEEAKHDFGEGCPKWFLVVL